jgi:hypothetical protein
MNVATKIKRLEIEIRSKNLKIEFACKTSKNSLPFNAHGIAEDLRA